MIHREIRRLILDFIDKLHITTRHGYPLFLSTESKPENQERAILRLIIDLDRLDRNIETLRQSLRPDLDFRLSEWYDH
jgi:hypothetical protein